MTGQLPVRARVSRSTICSASRNTHISIANEHSGFCRANKKWRRAAKTVWRGELVRAGGNTVECTELFSVAQTSKHSISSHDSNKTVASG